LNHQREQRLLAARELRALFASNEELLAEVNEWRSRNGMQSKTTAGWTETCEEIIGVENEVFGTFNEVGGQGDDGEEDGEGEMENDNLVEYDQHKQHQHQYAAGSAGLDLEDAAIVAATTGRAGSLASFTHHPPSIASSRQSVDVRSFVSQSSAFRSMPVINVHSRMSYASTDALTDVQSQFQQQQSQQNAMNAFLADSYDQSSLQSVPSQPSPLGGSGSIAGSNGDVGVVTPPPMLGGGVSTFVDSQPASTVAPTSFALGHNSGGDKVSDWAAQQLMLQFGQQAAAAGADGCSPFEQSDARSYFQQQQQFPSMPNALHARQDGRKGPIAVPQDARRASLLPAAHQSLMAAQPHLAAAVFPPAASSSPPSFINNDMFHAASMMGVAAFEQSSPIAPQRNPQATAAAAHAQIVQAASGLGLSAEQMEHWKRFAMQSFLNAQSNAYRHQHQPQPQQPSLQRAYTASSLDELRGPVRVDMSVGMGFAGDYNGNQQHFEGLEGFA